MQARILNKSEEHLWDEFIKTHPLSDPKGCLPNNTKRSEAEQVPLSTIHQTSLWGHFQAKIPSRGKYWIIVLEENLTDVAGPGREVPSRRETTEEPPLCGARRVSKERRISQTGPAYATASSKILGGTVLIRHKLPKGFSWLYAARGPLLNYSKNPKKLQSEMDALLKEIKKIAKEENSIFLRIDPPLSDPKGCLPNTVNEQSKRTPLHSPAPKFKNFKPTKFSFQPQHTLILNLTLPEDELLKQMKPKGRYNIHIAEKKGVKIIEANPANKQEFKNQIKTFHNILKETTSRDGFSGHDADFYKNMLETLSDPPQTGGRLPDNVSNHVSTNEQTHSPSAKLYLARYNGKIIAGIIVTFFNNTATYYYGASSNEFRNVMAPYLLQWHAIKEAKLQNFTYYDFFGIAPDQAKSHPWAGVTEFKKKFGGKEIAYIQPQEFSFKKLLHLGYKIYKRLKK